ncbi:heterokaryon incompatibility protein-domain-containing protein [Podospora fimiseda]|uniref:Heterokaryon incompatibility protein-domain-containing protein n=1 Tax=Podospora fimiseda TaxID=252190 RepID=A0AAN6YNT0_9PEZI|nr:heterokaryon incompatibility protein-domain-containing protein [Podospora fimiseda]
MSAEIRSICPHCEGFIKDIRKRARSDPELLEEGKRRFRGSWKTTLKELETSAVKAPERCALCLAFYGVYQHHQHGNFEQFPQSLLKPDGLWGLYPANDPSDAEYPGAFNLPGIATVHVKAERSEGKRLVIQKPVAISFRTETTKGESPLSRSVWSEKYLTLEKRVPTLKNWLQTCVSSHANCQSSFEPTCPTRLLDLDAEGTFRLISTAFLGGEAPSYTTLSHCWGSVALPRTLKSNLEEHQEGFPVERLPKSFQDAIRLTKALSIRYLWIDSLCIIQDDSSDWEHEAARMAEYYENSLFTIAASSSEDSRGGLFLENDNPELCVGRMPSASNSLIKARVGIGLQRDSIHSTPLASRGWVFQEWKLSRRVLHCTKDQLYWKCKSLAESEDGLENEVPDAGVSYSYGSVDNNLAAALEWALLVREYMALSLTYEKDRAPALAGIVDFYQRQRQGKPMLGCWSDTLAFDLGWHNLFLGSFEEDSQSPQKTPEAAIPSWSWISNYGGVPGSVGFELLNRSSDVIRPTVRTKLVEWNIEWSGPPMTSKLLSTRLVVEGPVLERERLSFKTPRRRVWAVEEGSERIHYDRRYYENDRLPRMQQLVLCLWDAENTHRELQAFQQQFLIMAVVKEEPLTCVRIGSGMKIWKVKKQITMEETRELAWFKDTPIKRIHLV